MEISTFGKLTGTQNKHAPGSVKQTGFPSPATHYLESSIDLQEELITNRNATFYVRVSGNAFSEFTVYNEDVLIIDRSLIPRPGDLALMIANGEFIISRIPDQKEKEELMLWGKITYIIHQAT